MRTIQFHGGFHLFCMGVALVVGVAGGMALEKARPQPRTVDVTDKYVIGYECGDATQRDRIYVAVEEDDLPGPLCGSVHNLGNPAERVLASVSGLPAD